MGEEVFIDSNIFIEIFLDEENAEACENFLKTLYDKNKIAVTTDFIIYSCLIVVQQNIKSTKYIKNVLIFFANYHNLRLLRPNLDELHSAAGIMESDKLDFDDSLVIACMKNYGITELASFDKHFDKVKWIKRIRLL